MQHHPHLQLCLAYVQSTRQQPGLQEAMICACDAQSRDQLQGDTQQIPSLSNTLFTDSMQIGSTVTLGQGGCLARLTAVKQF